MWWKSDEDISANVTPTSPPSTHIGPVTRARARQLNYQVLSFLANPSNVHEHMMLPKIDTFVFLMSEGPSMDKEDGHWSGIKHGKEGARAGKENGASSGDFRTLKPPYGVHEDLDEIHKMPLYYFRPRVIKGVASP